MREDRIWGDGFVDDDWRELTRVRDWSEVSTAELVRLFPGLVPADGRPSSAVAEIAAAAADAIEAELRAERPQPLAAASAADAAFLRRVISPERPLDAGAWEMARFAYLTAVHPAYVWPQAATIAAWGATAAWLGALWRYGAAFLPVEVAEYFADVALIDTEGGEAIRDPLIADLARRCVDTPALLSAVRRRPDDATIVVYRRRPDGPERRIFGALQRSLRRLSPQRSPTAAAGTPTP